MAQVIAPEVWQRGIRDNSLLPGRYTTPIFTGSGVNIANNAQACHVYDYIGTDYITDYDDRRLNGLSNLSDNNNFNLDGRDGWGASAFGVFQDVRYTVTTYAMGRHRSVAFRIFDEQQYSGGIGDWGSSTTSNVMTAGQNFDKTASILAGMKDLWEKEVLGPDIDKYNMFAALSGHIRGRLIGKTPDKTDCVFTGNCEDYEWIAQPGTYQGEPLRPAFAAIHGMEWDDENIPLMLNNIDVTWNDMFLPADSRVILLDGFYKIRLMYALTGNGIPATEAAYADVRDGNFTRLMGWDFDFSIPSQYWPRLYFDENLNVVHSADGAMECDQIINSINGGTGNDKLLQELVAAKRMTALNYVRTVWDKVNHKFVKVVTNYPLGNPSISEPYRGNVNNQPEAVSNNFGDTSMGWPYDDYGHGYGLLPHNSSEEGAKATGPQGTITAKKVIGCVLYKKAVQLSQEFSQMVTDEGNTRGHFSEMCMDIKYDAWVIESLSHGIIPIVEPIESSTVTYGIPVKLTDGEIATTSTLTNDHVTVSGDVSSAVTGNVFTNTTVANTVNTNSTATVSGNVNTDTKVTEMPVVSVDNVNTTD